MYKGIWIILAVILSCILVAIVILDISGNYTWTDDVLHVFIVTTVVLGIIHRILTAKKPRE